MTTTDKDYDEAIKLKDAGKLEEAAAKLRDILAAEPNHVLTHSAMAVVMQRLGNLEEAIAHAVKVTELEPNDPFSFTQLSVICQRCGRIPEAEDAMARSRMMQGGGHHH
jgi:Flp pilus assembly protein TadD